MRSKVFGKITIDVSMTILLMLLMAFELIGRAAHEWIGMGMFVLFIIHHILNRNWSKNLFGGKYTPFRVLQTALAILVLIFMLGSVISSILISREVFAFMPISGGRAFGRMLHMICAYWGFVMLALHLGVHWNMIIGIARKKCTEPSRARRMVLRVLGVGIAGYGMYAFVHRGFPEYMFLRTQFVFFDFDEPIFLFFLNYLAIMGLFIWIGYYLTRLSHLRHN